MQRILFIEKSATLRHALTKVLHDSDYVVDAVDDYEAGTVLLRAQQNPQPYACLILGWPEKPLHSTYDLLTQVKEKPYNNLPVLVLSHKSDSNKLAWVSSRKKTAFLLWDNHPDIAASLEKLLLPQSLANVAATETNTDIHILLVDDSNTARVKFRKLLESGGYQVDTADGASEALEKVAQHQYDIAIVDYFMPHMTGDQLCKKLRDHPASHNTLTAILTSTYHDKVISDSLAAGAVECMFKNEANALFMARIAAMSRTIQITKHIEQDKQQFEGILSSVGDGVYGVDEQGLITFVNPAALELLGYNSATHLIGKTPTETFHRICETVTDQETSEETEICFLHQAINEGLETREAASTFTCTDGKTIQVEMTVFPLHIDGKRKGAVAAFRDVSVRKLLEEELKWQANHDQLTRLFNRKYFEDALELEVNRLQRSEEKSALLYLDLDRFKYINDTIGHAAGDQLLIEISQQLQSRLRQADLLARLGGDEFAILMHNITDDTLFSVADEFRQLLEAYNFSYDSRTYKINGSIGVAIIDKQSQSPGEVLANADIACHISKGKGRNQTHVYDQTTDEKASMDIELGWSTRLREALENDSFLLHYQPVLALQDINVEQLSDEPGSLWNFIQYQPDLHEVYYEVLIRLNSQHNQPISPDAFLPTAERFNMMQDIDNWVLNKTLKQLVQMQTTGLPTRLSINISGQSLGNIALLEKIQHVIETWSLDPGSIIFEVTETSAINNMGVANQFIESLHKLGCRFALDDFGTGYSSFSHLKNLRVDIIKIDGQFVKDIAHDPMSLAIVSSMVNIAHSMKKMTVAEFVEDAATLRLLKGCGVDYAQGYYISRPLDELPPLELSNKVITPHEDDDDDSKTMVIKLP